MKTIDRKQILAVCELLGIDPNESHSILIEKDRVTVTRQILALSRGGDDR